MAFFLVFSEARFRLGVTATERNILENTNTDKVHVFFGSGTIHLIGKYWQIHQVFERFSE